MSIRLVRGLVASPEDWRRSSYRSYAYGKRDWWTGADQRLEKICRNAGWGL